MDYTHLVLSGLSPVPGTVADLKVEVRLIKNTLRRGLPRSNSGHNMPVHSTVKEFHLLCTFFPAGMPQKLLQFFSQVFSRKKNTYF